MEDPADTVPLAKIVVSKRLRDERVFRIRNNDEDAFASIFREYANGLLTFTCRHIGSRAIAEEIVQDVFFDLWERRSHLDSEMLLRAYLYQAVRFRVQSRYRSDDVERRYRDFLTNDLLSRRAGASPEHADDSVSETDLRKALALAIEHIPPRSRDVFVLNREHHLSYLEIAKTLEISIKTVEVHMGRALATLRERLGDWVT